MPEFSQHSKLLLATCAYDLVRLFQEVVKGYDCTVLMGARSEEDEQVAINTGRSHLKDPLDSKHVVNEVRALSEAVDVVPYPVVWPDKSSPDYVKQVARFYSFAGYVRAVAENLGIKIRYGGDWNGNLDFTDQTFDDLDHWELADK